MAGSLNIVGCGIAVGQITAQAEGEIRAADVVLFLLPNAAIAALVDAWSKRAINVYDSYREGRPRPDIYAEIAARVLAEVTAGQRVCLAIYGHPAVLCAISHEAASQARAAGFPARMLPGISGEACLYADLGLDIALEGVQSYEASRFVAGEKEWDPTTPLILWQVGLVGDREHYAKYPNKMLPKLVDKLIGKYGPDHQALIYEAAEFSFLPPRADRVALRDLLTADLGPACTLLVEPSIRPAPASANLKR